MQGTREQIIEAIQNGSVNGRLTCEQAHEISRTLGVELRAVGAVCDELKIKIAKCQLGCF